MRYNIVNMMCECALARSASDFWRMRMKKFLALLLAMLMLVALVGCNKDDEGNDGSVDLTVNNEEDVYKAEGEYNDAYTYAYIANKEVAITGFSGSHVPHAITVPSVIDELPVTKISEKAFYHMTNITAVTLPEGITVIGDMAFAQCSNLVTVNLPTTLTTVGKAVFADCTIVEKVEFAEVAAGATFTMGEMVFKGCRALTEVKLPQALTVIPAYTFMFCEKITTVTWSDALTAIGDYAFMMDAEHTDEDLEPDRLNTTLVSVNFPATLVKVGDYAFANCQNFVKPAWADGSGTVKLGTNPFFVAQ